MRAVGPTGSKPHKDHRCSALSGKDRPRQSLIDIDTERPTLAARIRREHLELPQGA